MRHKHTYRGKEHVNIALLHLEVQKDDLTYDISINHDLESVRLVKRIGDEETDDVETVTQGSLRDCFLTMLEKMREVDSKKL